MKTVDMSPKAISARLRQVSELRDLCLYLGRAGKEHRRKLAAAAGEATPTEQANYPEPSPALPTTSPVDTK